MLIFHLAPLRARSKSLTAPAAGQRRGGASQGLQWRYRPRPRATNIAAARRISFEIRLQVEVARSRTAQTDTERPRPNGDRLQSPTCTYRQRRQGSGRYGASWLRRPGACCHQLFDVRRVDIECFARDLEARGKACATVARRLCTIVGFYRYAEEEGVIDHSPAVHIRRPRIDYESHVAHWDRNKLGAILVAAGLSSPSDHALVSLLALNGLRVSEAIGANIEALGQERGHRTLTVIRKGGKLVTMPLAPRVARAIDLAVGERLEGPIFIDADGQPAGPPCRWADRAAHRPPSRDRQAGRAAHSATHVHHRRLGCRRSAA